MALTTTENVALLLNRDISTLSYLETAQIDMLLDFVDGVIVGYCGWNLIATEYTDKRFDGSGTDTLDLGVYPILAVESVRELLDDGTYTDHTASVEFFDDGTLVFLSTSDTGTSFNAGSRNWYVSFTGGYSVIPNELEYAATLLTATYFTQTGMAIGIMEQSAPEFGTKYQSSELPVMVKRVLDRYRKVSIY